MTEQDKEIAIQTIKDILHVLHEKRYADLPSCVDEMDWEDTEEIRECIQGTLMRLMSMTFHAIFIRNMSTITK